MEGLKQRSWIILPLFAGVVAIILIATRQQTNSFSSARLPGVVSGLQAPDDSLGAEADWAMEGFNPARTRARQTPLVQPITTQRAVSIPGDSGEGSPPVIVQNTMLVEAPDDLRAVDLLSGKQRWFVPMTGTYVSPSVADGRVFVRSEAANKGHVLALDFKSGKQLWSFTPKRLSSPVTSYFGGHLTAPVVIDGRVIVGAGKEVYALDASTGNGIWEYSAQDLITSSATIQDGRIYIADFTHIYALDLASGKQLWSFATTSSISFAPIVAQGTLFATNGSNLVALDSATGKERWTAHYPNVDLIPGAANDTLVFLKSTTDLYALDIASGKEVWNFHNTNFVSLPAVAGNDLFVVSGNGPDSALQALDAATGKHNWRMTFPNLSTAAPVIAGQTIYVRTTDGRVMSFWH